MRGGGCAFVPAYWPSGHTTVVAGRRNRTVLCQLFVRGGHSGHSRRDDGGLRHLPIDYDNSRGFFAPAIETAADCGGLGISPDIDPLDADAMPGCVALEASGVRAPGTPQDHNLGTRQRGIPDLRVPAWSQRRKPCGYGKDGKDADKYDKSLLGASGGQPDHCHKQQSQHQH